MAHSNRAKIKASRGGLTKNQARKAQNANRSTNSATRLQETIKWLDEKSRNPEKETVKTKIKRFANTSQINNRRKNVIQRLEDQLKAGFKPNKDYNTPIGDAALPLNENDIKRIKKELTTLKSRV